MKLIILLQIAVTIHCVMAKYIVSRKPEYFCGFSLGVRFDFKVTYLNDNAFKLEKDIIPWM